MCRFLRSEKDDQSDSWEVNLAKRYYAKLFKEYAIADLSRYKVCLLDMRTMTLVVHVVLVITSMY